MTIEITTNGPWVVVSKGNQDIPLTLPEQRTLLETLARVQDFSLVDREERRELMGLVTEVEAHTHSSYHAAPAGRALASAVSSALRFENDQEV